MTAPTSTGSVSPQREGGEADPASRHCAAADCDRAAIRTREGQRWCLYHPTAAPPSMDLLTGRLRDEKKQTPLRPARRKPQAVAPTPVPKPARNYIVRRYTEGASLPTLAREVHSSAGRVREVLVRHGVQIRLPGQHARVGAA